MAKTSRKSELVILAFAVFCSAVMHSQECGRRDWQSIAYNRAVAHQDDPRQSVVLDVRGLQAGLALTVYNRPLRQPTYFSAPSFFVSKDGGLTWQSEQHDQPASLNNAWSRDYVRSSTGSMVRYRLVPGLDLYARSGDGGSTWEIPEYSISGLSKDEFVHKFSNKNSHLQVFINAVHPHDPRILLASIRLAPWFEEDTTQSQKLGTVFISNDGGDHWRPFSDSLEPFDVTGQDATYPIGISPVDPNLYLGIAKIGKLEGVNVIGIVESLDGAKTWKAVGQQRDLLAPVRLVGAQSSEVTLTHADPRVFQFAFDPKDRSVMYLVSSKGVFKTTDGANSWSLLNVGVAELEAVNSIAVNPKNGKQLFVGSRYGLFRSDDGGCTFNQVFPTPHR